MLWTPKVLTWYDDVFQTRSFVHHRGISKWQVGLKRKGSILFRRCYNRRKIFLKYAQYFVLLSNAHNTSPRNINILFARCISLYQRGTDACSLQHFSPGKWEIQRCNGVTRWDKITMLHLQKCRSRKITKSGKHTLTTICWILAALYNGSMIGRRDRNCVGGLSLFIRRRWCIT